MSRADLFRFGVSCGALAVGLALIPGPAFAAEPPGQFSGANVDWTTIGPNLIPGAALGAGAAQSNLGWTLSGTGTKVVGLDGTVTNGHCPQFDASGGIVDSGAPCSSTAGSVAVGSTAIGGGTSGHFLYNNGGVLGDIGSTGSGSVVMSTSPTLTTPNLGTPSALNLLNATGLPSTAITGTLQAAQFPALTGAITTAAGSLATTLAAGAVGASNLAAGAVVGSLGFTPLSAAANLSDVTNIATARSNLGIAGTSITIAGTPCALGGSCSPPFSAAAGSLTGSTLASGVTASSLTSLGTLTSLPTSGSAAIGGALSVNGNIRTGGSAGFDERITALSGDGTITTELFAYNALGGYVGTKTNNPFILRTNDLDRVTIDTSGRVGIGNSTPAYTLDVNGTLNASGAATIGGTLTVSGNTLYIGGSSHLFAQDISGTGYIRDTTAMYLGYGANNVLSINAAGVGIQNTSPLAALDVGGSIAAKNIGDVTYVTPDYCPWSQLTGASSSNNNTCVQAAVNAACSAGLASYSAGVLMFARAPYYLTNINVLKSCSGLLIEGQGAGVGDNGFSTGLNNTYIFSDQNCTGPIFNLNSDATTNYQYGGGVVNIGFYNAPANGARDGSVSCKYPLIQDKYALNAHFDHIYAWAPYQLIRLVGGIHFELDDIYADQVLNDSPGFLEFAGSGAHPDATGATTRQDQVVVRKVFAGGNSTALTGGHKWFTGIWWHGFSATLQLENVAFESVGAAIQEDCTPASGGVTALEIGACPAFLSGFDVEAEGAGGNATVANLYDFKDIQSLNVYFLYAHCFLASTYGGCQDALSVKNSMFDYTAAVTITGGELDSAQHVCGEFEAANVTVTNMNIFMCNLGSSGGAGLYIDTPGSGHVSGDQIINNNRFCRDLSGNAGAMIPIVLGSGNDYIEAIGNDLHGCGSGITDGSGGTHNVLTPNMGP